MTYLLVPRHLILTALDLYRIVYAIPAGVRARVTDVRDGYVFWERLP